MKISHVVRLFAITKTHHKYFLLCFLVLMSSASGFSRNLKAQQSKDVTYPTWRKGYISKLHEAQKADRPLLERSIAEDYFNYAESKDEFPLMGESLAYLLRAQMKVAPDSLDQYLSYIDRMDASGQTVPTKSISHLLRGNGYLSMLNTIPQIARQEQISKILSAYRMALAPSNEDLLITTSTRDFMPMIEIGTTNHDAQTYSLYGVISRNVIAGMEQLYNMTNSSEERQTLLKEMSAIYSHWIALDKRQGYTDMAMMVQLDYYDWATRYAYELDKISFPYPALPTVEAYQKSALLPELYFVLAEKLLQKKRAADFQTAIDYYQLIVKKYPKYRRTPNAKSKLFEELAPSFELSTQGVFSTTDSILIHISYRNLDQAQLIFSAEESAQGRWTKRIPLQLKSVVDGSMQDTVVALAPVTYGRYTVNYTINLSKPYKHHPSYKQSSTTKEKSLTFCVSDLMVNVVRYPDNRTQLRLVDKFRGAPVSNGQIIIGENQNHDYQEQTFTTDENGVAFVPRELGSLKARATYKQDIYLPTQSIYSGRITLPVDKPKERATLLTDRKLYRPGDVVTLTAISYSRTSDEASVLKKQPMSVELISANGQVLQTETGVTDDMGVMTILFPLPEKMMKGSCRLRTSHPSGYASIQVEEYVAPTYALSIEQMADTLTIPRIVTSNVLTKLLSDIPLQNVAISYTLTGSKFPNFWGFRSAYHYLNFPTAQSEIIVQGQATTDAQGTSLLTMLVDSVHAIQAEYAHYSLAVVAISPTGERHETVCSFVGHYPEMKVETDTATQEKKEPKEIVPDSVRLPLWIAPGELHFTQEKPVVMTIHANLDEALLHLRYITVNGVIEEKDVPVKNNVYTLELPYKEIYGKSLMVQCSLVKEGTLYTELRWVFLPIPEKKLQLKWMTFRDHLLPGQKEQFQLQVLTPTGQPADAALWMTMYD
ncbi:MAG: MG2 domain-containing protein, partial [Bacteroidaceae bacterium]